MPHFWNSRSQKTDWWIEFYWITCTRTHTSLSGILDVIISAVYSLFFLSVFVFLLLHCAMVYVCVCVYMFTEAQSHWCDNSFTSMDEEDKILILFYDVICTLFQFHRVLDAQFEIGLKFNFFFLLGSPDSVLCASGVDNSLNNPHKATTLTQFLTRIANKSNLCVTVTVVVHRYCRFGYKYPIVFGSQWTFYCVKSRLFVKMNGLMVVYDALSFSHWMQRNWPDCSYDTTKWWNRIELFRMTEKRKQKMHTHTYIHTIWEYTIPYGVNFPPWKWISYHSKGRYKFQM